MIQLKKTIVTFSVFPNPLFAALYIDMSLLVRDWKKLFFSLVMGDSSEYSFIHPKLWINIFQIFNSLL